MADVTVRQAVIDDKPRVLEILHIAWTGQGFGWTMEQAFGPIGGKSWFDWMWPEMEKRFHTMPEEIHVTEVDGRVAGFVCLHLDRRLQIGVVGYNAVDPQFRGHGLGRRQIAHIWQIFEREKMRYAQVAVALNEGHKAAKHVYESFGLETLVFREFSVGRAAEVPVLDSGPETPTFKAVERPAQPWVREWFLHALEPWHRHARTENRYGKVNPEGWQEWVWSETNSIWGKPDSSVWVSELQGKQTGLALRELNRARETGIVHVLAVAEAEDPIAVGNAHVRDAAGFFRRNGMKYMSVDSWGDSDTVRQVPEEVLAQNGLTQVVFRGAQKFRAL